MRLFRELLVAGVILGCCGQSYAMSSTRAATGFGETVRRCGHHRLYNPAKKIFITALALWAGYHVGQYALKTWAIGGHLSQYGLGEKGATARTNDVIDATLTVHEDSFHSFCIAMIPGAATALLCNAKPAHVAVGCGAFALAAYAHKSAIHDSWLRQINDNHDARIEQLEAFIREKSLQVPPPAYMRQ